LLVYITYIHTDVTVRVIVSLDVTVRVIVSLDVTVRVIVSLYNGAYSSQDYILFKLS